MKVLNTKYNIRDTRYNSRTKKKGFALLEILITIILLTAGAMAILASISAGIRGATDLEDIEIASTLARDLMDEIMSKGFDDPDGAAVFGPEEAEPRVNYDDVDDYDGWSKNPPQDIGGTAYDGTGTVPDYSWFTRAVTVENVPEDNFNIDTPSADSTTDAKRIIVTVSWQPAVGGTTQAELKSVITEYHSAAR